MEESQVETGKCDDQTSQHQEQEQQGKTAPVDFHNQSGMKKIRIEYEM